jgi:uncharacterized protein YbjT (DUF2867 family)
MNALTIVVIGGTGLIGSKTVALLQAAGHAVRAAGPSTGVDTITGKGLADVLAGADVVIDVSGAPSFDPAEVRAFFETSGRNLLAAEREANVRHHIALSIVGTDRMPENGYFQAKVAQEALITQSGIPYTIVRSTQFFEFVKAIADGSAVGGTVRLAGGQFQPIAADDVAALLAGFAVEPARNGIVEIAGPERAPFDDIVRRHLQALGDPRPVERDDTARYFGGKVEELSLVPLTTPHLGRTTLAAWQAR